MHATPMSLTEIAQHVGSVEARDASVIYQQLRGLQQKGLFIPCDSKGARGAARFERPELVRARILTAFLDLGFGRNDIELVNAALQAPNLEPGAGIRPSTRLGMFMSDVEGGEAETWTLQVDVYRNAAGKIEIDPLFVRSCEFDPNVDRIMQDNRRLRGCLRQGRVTIYVSELVASLLSVGSHD